ncbi:MAG: hypothetical protein U0174_03500 [Polyangiaceae bacterium]
MKTFVARKSGAQRGGHRPSDAEVNHRLEAADVLLRGGAAPAEASRALVAQFGISQRCASAYVARVHARWEAESREGREQKRDQALARLTQLSRSAEARGAFGAAVQAEKVKAQINGLLAPQQVQVQAAVQVSPSQKDDFSLAAVVEELEAIEEILRAARPKLGTPPESRTIPT